MIAPSKDSPFANARILILEDNRGMRQIIWSVLTAFGCPNLMCCDSVGSALERLPHFSPDLGIVDYQLNRETGLDFVRSVRSSEDEAVATLPLIMVTSHTQITRVNDFINAGVDEILAKPMQAEALYRRIANVVNERRPYVRSGSYFGPDRRRRSIDRLDGRRRDDSAGDDACVLIG